MSVIVSTGFLTSAYGPTKLMKKRKF